MVFESVGRLVLVDTAMISACCLDPGHMEANTSFEKEEVVNYAYRYDGKPILLIEMGVMSDRTAFCC